MKAISVALMLMLWNVGQSSDLIKFLELPKYDGVSRVCTVNYETTVIADLLTKYGVAYDGALVLLVEPNGTTVNDGFAELTAQLLQSRKIDVCKLIIPDGLVAADLPPEISNGQLLLFKNGHRSVYNGLRTPEAFISFAMELKSGQVKAITGRMEKVAFDAVLGPKVVGFFMQNTPDFAAYEQAAQILSPSVPFYVVHDRLVAKHVKLDTIGQINLVKPHEKLATPCPVNPASAVDIEAFVNLHRGVSLVYVTHHNLHDPLLFSQGKVIIAAISDRSSPMGIYFHRLITKLVKNGTLVEATPAADPATKPLSMQDVSIVWIDPQQFPSLLVVMGQLESLVNLTPGLTAHFGVINGSASAWFDTSLLNTTGDKTADEANIQMLREWIVGVANNTIQSTNIGLQTFSATPVDVTVEEGGNFVLECVVANPVGDCLWLRNGQNIGFNLDRHAPHYTWRSSSAAGDCSLVVTVADDVRDSGEWVCEVTGDHASPTITSEIAVVTVTKRVEQSQQPEAKSETTRAKKAKKTKQEL